MLVVAVLHLLRVFYTAGFTPPREFNWVMGIGLFLLIVAANFTGYLLPWDQLAYWAVTVGTSLIDYIPIVGEPLTRLLLGGPEVGAATLTNFYGLHIAVIPLSLFGLASFHIWRVRKDKITVPRAIDQPADTAKVTTIPHLVSIEFVYALVWIALLLAWAAFVNAPLEKAADPAHSPNPAKAAWYFMGFQELLLHFHPVFGAIIIPGLELLAMARAFSHHKPCVYLYKPRLEERFDRDLSPYLVDYMNRCLLYAAEPSLFKVFSNSNDKFYYSFFERPDWYNA
jgi:quinol-cytochrome oxidoreductase complex cytochrome b subunit